MGMQININPPLWTKQKELHFSKTNFTQSQSCKEQCNQDNSGGWYWFEMATNLRNDGSPRKGKLCVSQSVRNADLAFGIDLHTTCVSVVIKYLNIVERYHQKS